MRVRGAWVALAGLAALALASVPAAADVKAGVDAWARGDYAVAVAEWKGPAAQGDADAQFNLAQAYRLGRGVPEDMALAETYYAKAAAQGHVKAADNYGLLLFQSGRREAAMPYVTAAAERGDPRAQYLLGIAHFNGDLVTKDWVRAYALLTLSNAAGLPQSAPALKQMDEFIPLAQRQQAQTLAGELKRNADAQRASQLAAADLAIGQEDAVVSPPRQAADASPVVPRVSSRAPVPLPEVVVPPSVAAAQAAVAEAMRATGTESPATAGADYARPNADAAPARVATARPAEPRAQPRVAPPPNTHAAPPAPAVPGSQSGPLAGPARGVLGRRQRGEAVGASRRQRRARGQASHSRPGRPADQATGRRVRQPRRGRSRLRRAQGRWPRLPRHTVTQHSRAGVSLRARTAKKGAGKGNNRMTEPHAAARADEPAAAAPDQPQPLSERGQRIASLDFIRGLAVMGILAANIVAFGQPFAAYMYPDSFMTEHGLLSDQLWIAQFVLIDGKMRGLFTLLFGAGMYLFMERAWAKGSTRWLQVRRLVFLLAFGLIHYFFIWRGDILIGYALLGLVALLFLKLAAKTQLVIGLAAYLVGALFYAAMLVPLHFIAETPFGEGTELSETRDALAEGKAEALRDDAIESRLTVEGDYGGLVTHKFDAHLFEPLTNVGLFSMETLPLMLIGMALYRMGLFGGGLNARRQRLWGWLGLAAGGVLSLLIALWAQGTGFSYYGTLAAFVGMSPIPRLMMVLGLAALLALWGARAGGWLAQRISAAGRAAFTNYLGTSIVMLLVFHGWAGGLFGELGRPALYLVVLATWLLMLAWSKPWLERFRYGPLEWLWRCLTYGRMFALRR